MASTTPKLDSWKEIATYLQRDERTAMRWAKLGMPVHRTPGITKGRVYAWRHEVDAWLAAQANPQKGIGENGIPLGCETSSLESAPLVALPPSWRSPRAWALLAVSLLFLGAAATAYSLWSRPGPPARFAIAGSTLTLYDSAGRLAWFYDFGFRLHEEYYRGASQNNAVPLRSFAQFADLDADGHAEFLFAAMPYTPDNSPAGYLACFDSRGNLLWKHAVMRSVRFGPNMYEPPFVSPYFLVSQPFPPSEPVIWAYSNHVPWFPSVITKLDSHGRVLAQFWHAGHVESLIETELEGRRVLLAGGTNNERLAASLAVLDVSNPTGVSPALEGDYRCQDCPPGSPLRYILFPQSEIGRLTAARPVVAQIVLRDNRIEVHVNETVVAGLHPAGRVYALDSALRFLDAELAENYVAAHNELRLRGVLHNSLDRREASLRLTAYAWNGKGFVTMERPAH